MAKYVAFLRGVNVGGRIIKMADLKSCFENAGFNNVATLLQSGNVIFESDEAIPLLKPKVEKALTKTFNYPAKAQVFPLEYLAKVVAGYPFRSKDGWHSYVIFIENGLEKDLAAEAETGSLENIKAGKGVVYWQVERGSTLKSPFAKLLTKTKYKDFNTNRNLNTLLKILK